MTQYTPIPNYMIHDERLNKRQFHTYCVIMEHCWNPEAGSFDWIDPTSMPQLSKLFSIPRTTLIEHLRALADIKVIKIHRISEIVFSIKPAERVGEPTELSASRPITIKYLTTKKKDSSNLKEENVGQPTPVGQPTVNVEIEAILRSRGVGEPIRTQFSTDPELTFEYVKQWLDFVGYKSSPVAFAIASIRDRLPAPVMCPICHYPNGKHGAVTLKDNIGEVLMCPMEDYGHLSIEEITEEYGELKAI